MCWIFASSSTCSSMNHWRNWWPRWSPLAGGDGRHPVELRGDRPLGLERPLRRGQRGPEPGRGRLEGRQVELDLVVGQEVHDLRGVLGLLDRLVAEELAPAVEALALEVEGDPQVQLMRRQLVADLRDQQLPQFLAEHRPLPVVAAPVMASRS